MHWLQLKDGRLLLLLLLLRETLSRALRHTYIKSVNCNVLNLVLIDFFIYRNRCGFSPSILKHLDVYYYFSLSRLFSSPLFDLVIISLVERKRRRTWGVENNHCEWLTVFCHDYPLTSWFFYLKIQISFPFSEHRKK
jgi:hypothetical protein